MGTKLSSALLAYLTAFNEKKKNKEKKKHDEDCSRSGPRGRHGRGRDGRVPERLLWQRYLRKERHVRVRPQLSRIRLLGTRVPLRPRVHHHPPGRPQHGRRP